MGERRGLTASGRKHVATALEHRGLLLVQGQAEIPSVADLLAGKPVTTRGYSWDYEPAWRLTDEYANSKDVAVVKLFRGKRTLVHRRLWAPVDLLAARARTTVLAGGARSGHEHFLAAVEDQAGIPMGRLREELGVDRRAFDRTRRDLDQWLCILGRERDDVEHHTHEPAFFPWSTGPIARGRRGRVPASVDAAFAMLRSATDAATHTPTTHLFPVARVCGPVHSR